MSQGNVDIARESVARFSASDMAGLAELYKPDAFTIAPKGWPEGGRFEGRNAVIAQFSRVVEEWGRQSMQVLREESGSDWVVLELVWNAQGRASGAPLEMKIVGAYRVHEDQIAEARFFFWDFAEAIAAVGLSE
jgi:ketosteroid isomerase-like protein